LRTGRVISGKKLAVGPEGEMGSLVGSEKGRFEQVRSGHGFALPYANQVTNDDHGPAKLAGVCADTDELGVDTDKACFLVQFP